MSIFKGLFDVFGKIGKKYEEVFSLKYGDIIWCKIKESKKYKFEGRHMLRPFTVLYLDEEYIYCLTHTHSNNIGKCGYYLGDRLGGSLVVGEVIQVKYKDFKNRFSGSYTDRELNALSRHLYNLYKGDNELLDVIRPHVCVERGDLVLFRGEKYLVRKEDGEKKVSLIKLVSKGKCDVSFSFDREKVYALRRAVVCDKADLQLVEIIGAQIIEMFENAKRISDNQIKEKNKARDYCVGNIILVDDIEKVVIDIADNCLIVVDENRNCTCVNKNSKCEIVGKISLKEVNVYKRIIEYDEIKRNNVLLKRR